MKISLFYDTCRLLDAASVFEVGRVEDGTSSLSVPGTSTLPVAETVVYAGSASEELPAVIFPKRDT